MAKHTKQAGARYIARDNDNLNVRDTLYIEQVKQPSVRVSTTVKKRIK